MAGVVLVNRASGPDDTTEADLRRHFPDAEIVESPPERLPDEVRARVEKRPDFVAAAGGDGTIRCVAEALAGTGVPLLPVPAGTRNHFARSVGVDSFDEAVAASHGCERQLDLGDVNGHVFVNNSSIGVYPRIVVSREAHERRLPKGLANIAAVWEQVRHGHRFDVDVNGRRRRVWMVFVGNGRYGERLFDLTERKALDEHVLDVRVVRADARLARIRVVSALLVGRLYRSPLLERIVCDRVEIDPDRAAVDVALDGEVTRLETPLRYACRPGALTVLVPSDDRKTVDR